MLHKYRNLIWGFILGIIIAILFAGVASAQVTIGVGQPDRGYERFGKAVVERLAGRHEATTENFEGSDAISRAVCDGTVGVGIMQIDAIYTRQNEGCKLRIIGEYGEEFAFMLVPADSDLTELHSLDGNSTVLVDTVGSGTDLFWQTIVGIETGKHGNASTWSKAKAVNDPTFLASAMASAGEIDAVLIVTTPDSPELKELVDAGWTLIEVVDKDINDELYNGTSLYPRKKATILNTGGFFSRDTARSSYVIRSFVVVGEAVSGDRRLFADVARAVKEARK